MTPADAASRLGVDAKRVRAWLRTHRTPPTSGRWELDDATFESLRADIASGRQRGATPSSRRDRDEIYVLDLCDELLGAAASRQHHFDWLIGDPGRNGRARTLPVDGYYDELKLVVEYREQQHDEAVAFFDKPDRLTVSGVHRGEQRRRYDRRRDDLLPRHGLRLWVIVPSDLAPNRRGRLDRRDHDRDMELLRRAWARFNRERPRGR